MENNINGKESNKKFINAIKRRRKKLFEEAKPFIESSNAEDVVEKIDDENFIKKEDKEEYDILMTLLSYLDFEKEPSENTYEFRGLEYKAGSNSYRASIFISKENALKISKLANDYEEKLRRSNGNPDDLKMSIKFPVELLMLKYKGTNMPGLDYEAPEPKLASQTIAEYEDGLENYYNGHGVDKEIDEDAEYRAAYPHEKIDYRQTPPAMSNVPANGYYEEIVRDLAASSLDADHGAAGLEPDQEEPIIGTDRPLGRRIGDAYLTAKNLLKSKTLKSKLLKGLVVAGLGIGAIACLKANPIITIMLAAGLGGGVLGIKYVLPPVQKGYRAIKKKIKEWLFGPELTNNPDGDNNGGATPSDEADTPDPQVMTPEELMNQVSELQREIQELEQQITNLTTEANSLAEGSPERAAKEAEIAAKRREQRAKLAEVSALLHNRDVERSRGGLGR